MKSLFTLGLFISALGITSVAAAKNGPVNCYIQAYDGHYLTAVSGGGRTRDVLHTDATKPQAWEKFTLVDADKGTPNITYGIRTVKGYYLTAVDGGGRIYDVMHSDATQIREWEEFQLEGLTGGWYAIRTYNGRYLTAVNSGGLSTQVNDTLHSDATRVGNWEKFRFRCGF